MLALSASYLSINDRHTVNHGLNEIAAQRGQGGFRLDRDSLHAAAEDVLHRAVVLLLDLERPERVVEELRARYTTSRRTPEAARLWLLRLADAIERAACGKAA